MLTQLICLSASMIMQALPIFKRYGVKLVVCFGMYTVNTDSIEKLPV